MKNQLDWDADADSAQRAARVAALRELSALVEARDRVRKRDPESVHQLRVDIRRLHSWLRVYRPALDDTLRRRTTRRLRKLAAETASVRDLDVQIEWLRAERKALGDSRLEAARWVGRSLKAERKSAFRHFRKHLSRQFGALERNLRRDLTFYVVTQDVRAPEHAAPMRATTAKLLNRQATALVVALERIRSPDDTRRLHRARIVAKRTRYVLEALAGHVPSVANAADELARFQDVVGELRDAQLLAHRVALEVTTVAMERTALVASELVYRPAGVMDFSRVVRESPFDASLSLLFARLHDRISAASRAVSAALDPGARLRLVAGVINIAERLGDQGEKEQGADMSAP